MATFRIGVIGIVIVGIIFSCGCESFGKKFIRKKKTEPKKEEMIIHPQDYSQLQIPIDEAYTNYYVYWKAWHKELLNFLTPEANKKKILSCFEQVSLNLNRMQDLFASQKPSCQARPKAGAAARPCGIPGATDPNAGSWSCRRPLASSSTMSQ